MAQVKTIQDRAAPQPIQLTELQRKRIAKRLSTEIVRRICVADLGECWLWQGCVNKAGYGQIRLTGFRSMKAHRLAFILENGDTPLFVCHRCDQPSCVRPDHLFAGTKFDNMRDCAAKGRTVYQRDPTKKPTGERHHSKTKPDCILRGEECKRAKLTNAQAEEIRARYKTGGISQLALAKQYGVRQCTVSEIVRGETYVGRQGHKEVD